MFKVSRNRSAAMFVGSAAVIALSMTGCGGGADGTVVQTSPEVQKKTEDYLSAYQKSMYDQHKTKPKSSTKPAEKPAATPTK